MNLDKFYSTWRVTNNILLVDYFEEKNTNKILSYYFFCRWYVLFSIILYLFFSTRLTQWVTNKMLLVISWFFKLIWILLNGGFKIQISKTKSI